MEGEGSYGGEEGSYGGGRVSLLDTVLHVHANVGNNTCYKFSVYVYMYGACDE